MTDAATLHKSRFGVAPSVVVKAPGRINLIGEHTDYCGLPVLPMAIRQGIQIAAGESPEPGLVALSTYDNAVISNAAAGERRGWAKYVLAVLDAIGPAAADRPSTLIFRLPGASVPHPLCPSAVSSR